MSNTFNNIRYWNTQSPGFTYPEMEQNGPLRYAPIQDRANAGICVSGGGSVSASLIAGYYAALSQLAIMGNLRYISGVSGGTWGSAPFIYGGSDSFSGEPVMPQEIDVKSLQSTKANSMQDAAANADIADKCAAYILEAKVEGTPLNRIYERGVGACFLNPFGIKSPNPSIIEPTAFARFFSSTPDMVADIRERNPGVKNDFLTMAKDMPFLIMNATMFVPIKRPGMEPTNYIYPVEITPLYTGIKAPQTTGNDNQNVGGFFVESFGFNTTLTDADNGAAEASGTYPFELCQPVAASGSALEQMLENDLPKLLGCFPQFNYWNPLYPQQGTVQYDFGDGGCIEDTGITSLLARGVQNIGAFLTEPVFFPGTDTVGCLGFGEHVFGYNQIADLFGAPLINAAASAANGMVQYLVPANTAKQVFENSEFQPLLTALLNARNSGNGMVVSMQMTAVANNLFGITPAEGYQPQVIWSVIDKAANWTSAMPDETSSWIKSQPSLTDFPEVGVFFQNPKNIIALTAPQTNLLANFGYWMVMNNQDIFKSVLTPASVASEAEIS